LWQNILRSHSPNIAMLSRISEVRTLYGKYSEILPDELNDKVENDLKNGQDEMEKIFKEDIRFIDNMIKKSNGADRINLQDFKSSDLFLIRRGFLDRNEQLIGIQKTKFDIAHLFMCKSTLSYFLV